MRASGVLPAEKRRENGGSAGASLTPMSREFHSGGGERRLTMPRVWPGTSVIFAPVVLRPKRLSRDWDRAIAPEMSRGVHQLRFLPAERDGVPGDEVGRDGLLHFFALIGGGLLEIFVEEPGAGGPGVVGAIGAFVFVAVELFGGVDGFGEKFVEVSVDNVGLRVDEAGVEVAFEDDEDAFDFGGWRGRSGGCRSLKEFCWIEWSRAGDPCCAAGG